MKAIIIYNSKTGFTKRYASWIQEATGFDIKESKSILNISIESYDLVIYGGRIHAGQIDGLKKMKKKLGDKQLIVFATGATPGNATELIQTIWNKNFTKEEQETIPHYYFQSGLNYENMKWGDRFIMSILAKILSKKSNKSSEESGCEQAISQSYDISSKEFIIPLIDYVKP